VHPACNIGLEVPAWDIRDKFGDTNMLVTTMAQAEDLAKTLGSAGAALMCGHGCVIAAPSLREAVLNAIYIKVNARLQAEAMALGPVRYLTEGEIKLTQAVVNSQNALQRAWEYWARRAGVDNL
jgi:HCOMODA/2-hydroxy-3-carboxy-muconic semialdehyde decarboxylase